MLTTLETKVFDLLTKCIIIDDVGDPTDEKGWGVNAVTDWPTKEALSEVGLTLRQFSGVMGGLTKKGFIGMSDPYGDGTKSSTLLVTRAKFIEERR